MTKKEALEALDKGNKITHEFFTDDEYIHLVNDIQYFEDGVRVPDYWWSDAWKDNNWSIYKS